MPDIWILVAYDGKWVETAKKFVGSTCTVISVPVDINFAQLLERMYLFLQKNSNDYRLTMLIDTCAEVFRFMDVSNDDDVRIFIRLSQAEKPCLLYLTTKPREQEPGIGISGTNRFLDPSYEPLRQKCLEIFRHGIGGQGQSRRQCGSKESESKGNHRGLTIEIGTLFIAMDRLYLELSINAILEKFQFVVETCSNYVLAVRCLDEKCKWRFCANKSSCDNSFNVVENDNAHTCSPEIINGEHRQATRWIVERLTWKMHGVPGLVYKPDAIVEYIQSILGVQISLGKAAKARQHMLEMFKSSPEGLYSWLLPYCALLMRENPGTVMHIETDNANRFKYLFMALHASIHGWLACRPVIAIDAVPMEAYGMLLGVTCKDGNDQIFPLAFGIVDSENNESWEWFLTKFKEAFWDRHGLVVISKHTPSVCYAVNKVYPKIEHHFCLQHLLQDVNAKFKKELEIEPLFKRASETNHFDKFCELMYHIHYVDRRIFEYLVQVGCKNWARVYFSRNRFNIMRTGIAEFLNGIAEKVGNLATIAVVGHLTLALHDLFSERRKEASKMTSVTKWALYRLRDRYADSVSMKVFGCGNDRFNVIDEPYHYDVDFREKTCTCREFELGQLLCSHALAVLNAMDMVDQSFYAYCSHYYTRQCLEQTYAESIHPPFMSILNDPKKIVPKLLPPASLWSGVRPQVKQLQFFDKDEDDI